jgi:hypothetical protein
VQGSVGQARVRLFAQSKYLLYVNGKFISRGPAYHHATQAPFDCYDITSLLEQGTNVISMVVQALNMGLHHHVTSGEPGLCAAIHWDDADGDHQMTADAQWRVSAQTGWCWPTPQRTWAIGPIEVFDMAQAQPGWQQVGFDDSRWQTPEISPLGSTTDFAIMPVDRPVPLLEHRWVEPQADALMTFHRINEPVLPIAADDPKELLARRLEAMPLHTPVASCQCVPKSTQSYEAFSLTGCTAECGVRITLDMKAFYVGQVVLECECPSSGTIDIAWCESLVDGKPVWSRKGACYVDRIHAVGGTLDWRPITFSGMRYVTLFFRGFAGDIHVRKVGLDTTEPQLQWGADFQCSDSQLNAIWDVCVRTLRVGTQEALMDCPTREQATYVGDGLPVAQWITRLTGDTRFWKDLIIEQFRRQSPSGLIRSTPYSWRDDTLIDYNLIAIIGTRDYLKQTGDTQTVAAVLPAAKRLLAWFTNQVDANAGLLSWQWTVQRPQGEHEHGYDPKRPLIQGMNLFIDHAGMGWHNIHDAGIDRRGINAALHAFLVLALDAMAQVESQVGDPTEAARYERYALQLRERCEQLFADTHSPYFVDGVLDGKPLKQITEQTNTLAVLAGWCSQQRAASMLGTLLTQADKTVARNGYYFWIYTFAALNQLGMQKMALEMMRRYWWPVIEAGATTVWETMAGDDLDSHCHPWSCVPASMLLTDILGLGGLEDEPASLQPRYDLLSHAQGSMFTKHGQVQVQWRIEDGQYVLSGLLPHAMTATLLDPQGNALGQITGQWQMRVDGLVAGV